MGVQIQCTQCHNHPVQRLEAGSFLAAQFVLPAGGAAATLRAGTRRIRAVELANQDFGGEGSTPEEAEVYYELRNGRLAAAYPVFLDGTPLTNRSGFIDDVNRRERTSALIVTSRYLPAGAGQSVLELLLGLSASPHPIDDMGPHNATPHQALSGGAGRDVRATRIRSQEAHSLDCAEPALCAFQSVRIAQRHR